MRRSYGITFFQQKFEQYRFFKRKKRIMFFLHNGAPVHYGRGVANFFNKQYGYQRILD